MKKETIELLTVIYRANSRTDKQAVLQEARERDRGHQVVHQVDERHATGKFKKVCTGKSKSGRCIQTIDRLAKVCDKIVSGQRLFC